MPPSKSIAPSSVIAAEGKRLRELLDTGAASVGGIIEPVTLPADDPEPMRAFWGAVGWNDAWTPRWKLYRPEPDLTARKMRGLLAQLRTESPSSPALRRGVLPRRFRLVDIDSAGLGFAITNEDDPETCPDPPVLAIIFESGEIVPLAPSYLNWCSNQLLSVALNGWYQLDVSVASTNAVLAAESPLPSLSPATRRLGKGLWALPAAPEAMSTGPDLRLAYDRFEEVVRWLMAQPQGQKVGIFVFTEGAIAVPPVVAARAERLFDPGAQRLPGIEPGESYVAGFRAGRPLLLKRSADGNEVVTAEDQLDWLRTQIDQL